MKNSIPNYLIFVLSCLLNTVSLGQVSRVGLVAEYHLSSNALDSSGMNNNGTIYNAVPAADIYGVMGNALYFDGTSSYVYVPHSPSLDFNDKLTVYAIAYPMDYTTNHCQSNVMVSEWTASSQQGFAIQFSDQWYDNNCNVYSPGHDCFYGATANNSYNGSVNALPINLNQWYCFAYVQDSISQSHYVNGFLEDYSIGVSPLVGLTSAPLTIAMNSSSQPSFKGIIDEVYIYNRPLSALEILSLCPSSVTPRPMVGLPESLHVNLGEPLVWMNDNCSIHLKYDAKEATVISAFDISGRLVWQNSIPAGSLYDNDCLFPSRGVYFLQYQSVGAAGVKKVVVN